MATLASKTRTAVTDLSPFITLNIRPGLTPSRRPPLRITSPNSLLTSKIRYSFSLTSADPSTRSALSSALFKSCSRNISASILAEISASCKPFTCSLNKTSGSTFTLSSEAPTFPTHAQIRTTSRALRTRPYSNALVPLFRHCFIRMCSMFSENTSWSKFPKSMPYHVLCNINRHMQFPVMYS